MRRSASTSSPRPSSRAAYTIAENAGFDGDIVVEKVKEGGKGGVGYGFNAATGEYTDLVKAGIIDPALVAKTALHQRRQRRGPDAHDRGGGGGDTGEEGKAAPAPPGMDDY